MTPLEVFPPALPLDGADVIAAGMWFASPLIVWGVGFALACLTFAFLAALSFSRSVPPTRRYRRTPMRQSGVDEVAPEASSAPFPNLLGK